MLNFHTSVRWSLIVMALFPTLWGLLSFMNNTSGFAGTVEFAVLPLISMTDTYGNAAQTWRAIPSALVAHVGLVIITLLETLAGVAGLIALIKMLRARRAPAAQFESAKAWLVLACTLAIAVWGIGFAVIAGDYFLAWQAKSTLATQIGGLIYAVPCFLTLILAVVHKES